MTSSSDVIYTMLAANPKGMEKSQKVVRCTNYTTKVLAIGGCRSLAIVDPIVLLHAMTDDGNMTRKLRLSLLQCIDQQAAEPELSHPNMQSLCTYKASVRLALGLVCHFSRESKALHDELLGSFKGPQRERILRVHCEFIQDAATMESPCQSWQVSFTKDFLAVPGFCETKTL